MVDSLVGGVEVQRWWTGVEDDGEHAQREGGRGPTVDSLVGDMEAHVLEAWGWRAHMAEDYG
jgi:hypothetical protein